MKNREVIMYQLNALSDEDFWRAIEPIVCPDCYKCPATILNKCNSEHEVLCMDGWIEWLNMKYDLDDNLLIRNLEAR